MLHAASVARPREDAGREVGTLVCDHETEPLPLIATATRNHVLPIINRQCRALRVAISTECRSGSNCLSRRPERQRLDRQARRRPTINPRYQTARRRRGKRCGAPRMGGVQTALSMCDPSRRWNDREGVDLRERSVPSSGVTWSIGSRARTASDQLSQTGILHDRHPPESDVFTEDRAEVRIRRSS